MNAAEFNARYPIGTPVIAYPGARPEGIPSARRLVTRTRSEAQVLGGHTDVVWVDGHGACIALTHIDVAPRTNTPDSVVVGEDGRKNTTVKLKRACNGCGQSLGDVDNRDVDEHGNLTDVRAECPVCQPLLELEAAGCDVRRLTERSIGDLWGWIDSGKPFYSSDPSNTKWGPDGCPPGLKVDGLSVFNPEAEDYADRRHVARFGDWIIHHPNGRWSVHAAQAGSEATR